MHLIYENPCSNISHKSSQLNWIGFSTNCLKLSFFASCNVTLAQVPTMTSSMRATTSIYADTSGIETGSSEASAFTSSLPPFQLNAFAHKMSRSAVVNKRVTYTLSYTLPSGDAMPFKTTLDGHPHVTLKQIKKLLPSKLRSNVV